METNRPDQRTAEKTESGSKHNTYNRLRRPLASITVATLAAAGLLSCGVEDRVKSKNETQEDKIELMTQEELGSGVSLLGAEILVDGETATGEVDTEKAETTKEETWLFYMKWAENFKDDPDANKLRGEPGQIAGLVKHLSELRQKGYDIDSINLKGFASDEPNFGDHDQKNTELAEFRAVAFKKMFKKELAETFDKKKAREFSEKIHIIPGEEVSNKVIARSIATLAEQSHTTVKNYTEMLNRTAYQDLTTTQKALRNALNRQRLVSVEIIAATR